MNHFCPLTSGLWMLSWFAALQREQWVYGIAEKQWTEWMPLLSTVVSSWDMIMYYVVTIEKNWTIRIGRIIIIYIFHFLQKLQHNIINNQDERRFSVCVCLVSAHCRGLCWTRSQHQHYVVVVVEVCVCLVSAHCRGLCWTRSQHQH